MSSTPRTKYGEYKEKLKEWSRLFEDEYGRRPTDDDRYDSATWVALNDKARHYRRLAGEEATPSPLKRSGSRGSRRHLDRSESTESVSRRHSQGQGGSSKSLDRDGSPAMRRPKGRERSSTRDGDGEWSGGGGRERSSSAGRKSRGHRRSASDPDLIESSPSPNRKSRGHARSSPLSASELASSVDDFGIPTPAAAATPANNAEYAALEAKVRDAKEKLAKWERAFEREQGEPPRAEDKAASGTYQAYEKKHAQWAAQLEQLAADIAAHGGSSGGGGGGGGGSKAGTRAVKKRLAVSAEAMGVGASDDVAANAPAVVIPKSKEAEASIAAAAKNCILFAGLGPAEFRTVVDAMFEVKATAGQTLIAEGEKGDNFYIVQSGSYSAHLARLPGKAVKSYTDGDAFGELALLYNCPRAATIKCTGSGTLWAVDRGTFRAILCSSKAQSDHEMADFLQKNPLFSSLTSEQITKVAAAVQVLTFSGGEFIVRQGERADAIYFIKEGKVVCKRRGSDEEFPLAANECFGESALNDDVDESQRLRKADVLADGDTAVVQLQAADFQKLLGTSLQEVASKNFNKKILSAIKFDGTSLASILSSSDMTKLLDALEDVVFADGESVIEEGATGDTFFIIKNGRATVSTKQKGEVATLTEGDYFGEMALVRAEPRSATIAAHGPLSCLALNRITFTRLLGPLQERLAMEMDRREMTLGTLKFSDLDIRQILGVGSFGQVRLAVHTPTDTPYALKSIYKGQVIATNQVEHILNEKKIMQMCSHPFLIRLAAAYQDADTLFMLVELVLGGELFSVLRQQGSFQEPVAAFYGAITASAFEYLHDRQIVYRDLKPENLLLDSVGYLKVIDFGFAKEVASKTWTLCGTPEYLAPEIILNKGHNSCADWWSLGVLIYEMIMGGAPFADDHDPMQIYQKILRGVLPQPKPGQKSMGKDAKGIVDRLLTKEPTERLGCMKHGVDEVKRHAFFSKINWQRLEKKLIQAPYIPSIDDPLDTSNFDQEWEVPENEYKASNNASTAHLFESF